MFNTFPGIRFSQFVALALTVALLASSGCRCLTPKSSITKPSVPSETNALIPPAKLNETDHYSAFRPIMPEQFTPQIFVSEQKTPILEANNDSPKIESTSDTADQSKIDELNRKITELESQLAETKNERQPKSLDDLLLPIGKAEVAPVKTLPIINKQGVTIYLDDTQCVRIEIMDKILFMPNTWQLTAEGDETLRMIAAEIRAFDPKASLDIEGYTDSLVYDPNNLMQKHDISSIKTMTVMEFFVNTLRWDVTQIGTSSFGRSRPVADNGTPEGRARNNRIEIVLRSQSE